MAIAHLIAEGIGPFDRIHLDLSDGKGNARLGPHILAGTNGSGKTTLLKAIAWAIAGPDDGFPRDEWQHLLTGYEVSRVLVLLDIAGLYRYAVCQTNDKGQGWEERLSKWTWAQLSQLGESPNKYPRWPSSMVADPNWRAATRFGGPEKFLGRRLNAAAYSSAKSIKYLGNVGLPTKSAAPIPNNFSFDSTVQNEAVQAWILSLYSKRAIAKERRQASGQYTASLDAFEKGLKEVFGEDVSLDVEIEPNFQPSLHIGKQVLNFSQIPDGVRATVGWLADFMMRSDNLNWDPQVVRVKPGLLLLDEIDAYLHPLWQRRLLPAMRDALPQTQILVTSHSPFVISSCPGSVVHVLKTDEDGKAYVEPPVEAPIGESITATLKDIFGVSSRFDVQTERELNEWNELSKMAAQRKLSAKQKARYGELSNLLKSRGEETRSIVQSPSKLPKALVETLESGARRRSNRKAG